MPEQESGFTLVELLTVVAIVALLLAMLTPAMDQAMAAAERATCAAKLHGIGNASAQYRLDNRRYFPSRRIYNDVTDVYVTYKVWGGKIGRELYDEGSRQVVPNLINPYVGLNRLANDPEEVGGALELFHCPSDAGAFGGWWKAASGRDRLPTSYYTWGSSYLYNNSGNNNDFTGLQNKRDINNPHSRVVEAGDFAMAAWFMQPAGQPFQEYYWHNPEELGWANLLFVDGHANYTQAILMEKPDGTLDHINGPDYTFAANRQP